VPAVRALVVDLEELLALRSTLNEQLAEDGIKLSVNDLLVKACATALRVHPGINVSWAGDKILRHHRVNVAVALEGGLVVPVLPDTDRKGLGQISSKAKALVAKARVRSQMRLTLSIDHRPLDGATAAAFLLPGEG
jgi:pyruvate dehydrogenase E2 component (dihydrolipoamide acetyltransferase)